MKALFTRKTRTTAERSEISERSSEKSKGRLSLGRSLKKLRLSIEDGASKKALEKKRSATTPTLSSPQLTESTTTSCSSDVGVARFVVNSKAPLGSGSYGQVLPAVDQITGEHVAVKCIADGRMRPEALEREVAILRRLSAQGGHPNVVGFVDYTRTQVGADGGRTLPPKVQGGHFDTELACETFMQHGPRGRPDGIVVISPIDGPSNVLILKNWAGSKVPTAEEFADHATRIDIPADHTLLMSEHMPHAGGDIAGRRAHAIITRPDLAKRKPSEKETFWLKPASAA